jgi:DNA-directed RNA polymerase subunit N (RpoN/RPB10)
MIKKRCFLCGHKMAENGLCTNVNCIRSEPVTETEIKDKSVTESTEKRCWERVLILSLGPVAKCTDSVPAVMHNCCGCMVLVHSRLCSESVPVLALNQVDCFF